MESPACGGYQSQTQAQQAPGAGLGGNIVSVIIRFEGRGRGGHDDFADPTAGDKEVHKIPEQLVAVARVDQLIPGERLYQGQVGPIERDLVIGVGAAQVEAKIEDGLAEVDGDGPGPIGRTDRQIGVVSFGGEAYWLPTEPFTKGVPGALQV